MMKKKGEKQEGEEEEKGRGRRFNLTYSVKHLDTFDNSAQVGWLWFSLSGLGSASY